MNQRDAKFYTIVIAAALLLAVLSTALTYTGRTGPLRNAALTVTMPLRSVGTGLGDKLAGVGDYFAGVGELRDENAALRAEIAELQKKLDERSILVLENENLRDMLDVKESSKSLSDYSFLPARVVSYESADHISVLTIDRGTRDGVKLNQTVMTAEGLVGRVSDVGQNWAKVSTVIGLNSRTGAYIERTGLLGVIGGSAGTGVADPALKERGFCLLSYLDLPVGSDPSDDLSGVIAVGDRVVTSGIGYVFPGGIFVGTVAAIRTNPYDRTVEAVIRPAVDFSVAGRADHLTDLFVLLPAGGQP